MPTRSQLARVTRFLSIFERPGFTAGEWDRPEPDKGGIPPMPDVIFSDEVSEFIAACYASTLLRLLTTHLRADRFCEGHLLGMFESGHIVRFLRRLKELEDEYD